jgi:uncharacterized protein YegP (UPF0339 family)
MLLRQSLSPLSDTDPALDQAHLFALGLEHVRELARQVWTDHNTHDPGITTLELLCYALTDLSYRVMFPLQDLLAAPVNTSESMAAQFFTARNVLPNRPLTLNDYRKLLIDIPQVRNAWLSRHRLSYEVDLVNKRLQHAGFDNQECQRVHLHGLYDVRLEYTDEVETTEQQQSLLDEVARLLHANRNLCEDFVSIESIATQPYALCAEIELTPTADQDEVEAQVFFQVDQYLAPPVIQHTLAEMLAKPHRDGRPRTADEIFDGPLLRHGFIDDGDLAASELRTEIRLSDIIRVIMGIDGVRAVGDIALNEVDVTPDTTAEQPRIKPSTNQWRLQVPEGRQPRLAIEHGRLVLHQRHLPLRRNAIKVRARLTQLKQEAELHSLATPEDLPLPRGRHRQTAPYHSFQHHFPACYGLSATGLPSHVDERRRAQALQFKGYLLFFDQVMANFCAQLSQLSQLFSRQQSPERTYFAQLVSFPDSERIYSSSVAGADQLADLLETPEDALRRRHRVLDHLLARCGENLSDYLNAMRISWGLSGQELLDSKQAFLQYTSEHSGRRGLAYDQTQAKWNCDNVSELERRLATLLGIATTSRRNLATVTLDEQVEIESTAGDEFRFRIKHPASDKILLSSTKNYPTREAAQQELELAIQLGQQRSAYDRKSSVDGRHFFNIVAAGGEVIARRIEFFNDEHALEDAIDEVLAMLRNRYSNEGMYLIENILLRPEQDQDGPFLPICIDPTCTDCTDNDPYSYRIQIILPANTGRFVDLDFRRFVEETIRQETPAHLLPKICWADAVQMLSLQEAYRNWIEPSAGGSAEQRRQNLDTLVSVLSQIKNVYPKRRLPDSETQQEPSFILDRTQLGSLD